MVEGDRDEAHHGGGLRRRGQPHFLRREHADAARRRETSVRQTGTLGHILKFQIHILYINTNFVRFIHINLFYFFCPLKKLKIISLIKIKTQIF